MGEWPRATTVFGMRALLIAPLAVVVLALAACGGGDTKTATVTVPATTTTPVAPKTLTAAGYAALIQFTYLTNRDLSPAKFASRCERLGTGAGDFNEEVGAIREACATLADIQASGDTVEKCPKKYAGDPQAQRRCFANGLDQIAAYSSDAIDASKQIARVNDMAAGPCRDYLLDPREVARLRGFARAARSTAATFRDDNAGQDELQRAVNRLEIAFKRFARSSTSKSEQLTRARSCRPAA